MYITDVIKKYKKIDLYVDMDGVIADYDVGVPKRYDLKRPLYSNISKLEEISKMPNIQMHILSVSRMHEGLQEKNKWLDKFAPFFKKENRTIIVREDNEFKPSKFLKEEFVKNIKRDKNKIIIIDDDPEVLHQIMENNKDVILLKDTTLIF